MHFILNNSPVHFTLDQSWCLSHNCGIWDWNVKVALLEEIFDAWVAVALTSLPIKFPMLKGEEYGFSLKYSTGAMQGSPLAVPSASILTFSKIPTSFVRMFPCLWGSVQCVK